MRFLLKSIVCVFLLFVSAATTSSTCGDMTSQTTRTIDELGQAIKAASEAAVAEKGVFSIAFSGGSLPKAVASALVPMKNEIDFNKWIVVLADERHVPWDHSDSNFFNYVESFESALGIQVSQVVKHDYKLSLTKAAKNYAKQLYEILPKGENGFPELDVVLLGVGPDGHTCSLFPNHPLLQERSEAVAPIDDSPKPPPQRITLTFPTLEAAKHKFFVATGESKREILSQILSGDSGLPASLVPAAVWFVDEAAAASKV